MDSKHDIGWAIEQMKAGKKVKRPYFATGRYIALTSMGSLINRTGREDNFSQESVFACDWELYEESPGTFGFVEAMRRMERGAKVRRSGKEWFMDGELFTKSLSFTDVMATDWIER